MKRIGITGPIGSGKSHISKAFAEQYNIPVFDSDSVVKLLYDTSPVIRTHIFNWLGSKAFNKGDISAGMDREFISNVIFNDPEAMERMVAIIRGPLMDAFYRFCYQHEYCEDKPPFVLFESAILMQRNFFKLMDGIIIVCADKETRLARVIDSRCMSPDAFNERNSLQSDCEDIVKILDKFYVPYSVIENNGNPIKGQVDLVAKVYGWKEEENKD